MINSTTATVLVLLVRLSKLLPQYQSYIYDTVHYCPITSSIDLTHYTTVTLLVLLILHIYECPGTSLTDLIQSSNAPVPVLLIPYSPLLSQYYSYDTVHYGPRISPTYKLQYNTAQVSALLMSQSTADPVPVLVIFSCPLLPKYQSY